LYLHRALRRRAVKARVDSERRTALLRLRAKSKRKKAKKATQPNADSNGGGSYAAIAAHHDRIASDAPIVPVEDAPFRLA
jgi:hypothetical protein